MLATERKILFQTTKTSFIHKVSQCSTLMCTEIRQCAILMVTSLFTHIVYSEEKKLHMCRKMNHTDRRQKNIEEKRN